MPPKAMTHQSRKHPIFINWGVIILGLTVHGPSWTLMLSKSRYQIVKMAPLAMALNHYIDMTLACGIFFETA